MHIFARIMFWLGLAGLAVSLLSPVITSGASYTESASASVVAFILCASFALASVKWSSPDSLTDPFERAKRSWSAGLAYTIALAVVLGIGGAVTEVRAQDDLSSSSVSDYDDAYAYGQSRHVMRDTYRSDHAANGSWAGVVALCAAGLSLVWAIRIGVRKPAPAAAFASYVYAHPSSYPPPPYYGYAVQGTVPTGYAPQGPAFQGYGPPYPQSGYGPGGHSS